MDRRIIFRLPDDMFNEIKQAIRKGKAKTTSELMRKAIRELLKEVE